MIALKVEIYESVFNLLNEETNAIMDNSLDA